MPKVQGFTLIELLLVLVLLGVLSTLVLLGSQLASSPQRALEYEAQRLQMLLQVLLDEAVLEGREYGLLLSEQAYQVLQLEQGRWQRQEKIYRLPPPVQLSLEIEARVQPLAAHLEGDEQNAKPQLLVLSSGEYSPFRLQLKSVDEQLTLLSDGFSDPRVLNAAGWAP